MQDDNVFGCKIYSESIFLGLNLTLHTHNPYINIASTPGPSIFTNFQGKLEPLNLKMVCVSYFDCNVLNTYGTRKSCLETHFN